MKQLIVLILIITSVFSCNNNENTCGQAYLGGEIINPNNDFLTLYRDSEPLDTLYLDEKNRFSYHIESLNPGLYTIVHGDEAQFAIIEPTDSLMIRLNTFDFDESFVFSGRGSKKNNYLINLFLSLEKGDRTVYRYSKLHPDEFLKKLDSIKEDSYKTYEKFNQKYESSDLFKKIAQISIDYNYYSRKELYPYRHFGMNKPLNFSDLPEGYFDFRKDINYNDEELTEFYPYYNFLFPHFNNIASEKYFETLDKKSIDNNSINQNMTKKYLDRYSVDYNLIKLELMDSLVHSEVIKNVLLKYATRNFLSNCSDANDSEVMYNSYVEKNTNEKHSEYITNLYNSIKRLQIGNQLPEVEVIDYKNRVTTLNSVTSKPTVLYFWSNINKIHFKNSHKKVEEYREQFPDVDFISVNINSNNYTVWKRLLAQNRFKKNYEYRFNNPQVAKKLLAIQYINKVIIVDKDNTIIESNANLFNYKFKHILKKLQ